MIEWTKIFGHTRRLIANRLKPLLFLLFFGIEAVLSLERQISSLRLDIQEELAKEQNACLHLQELEALDEKRLEAQQSLECYKTSLLVLSIKRFA